ncbi:alpha-ribazole phosphatase/probable phosphoglycerate mutase [Thermosporothrix hazakensis]|jgi:broad specificity phosphatase PhoE|nr:histidine phosphatase family protein [Thermosporothrix hazakensis]PZW36390.1 alpha-ribazole phosphatase/probable phosphoglycerate mutase [Thermosporothrix hazakensis]
MNTGTTRLLFVRHGQTRTSRDGYCCGRTEVPLTEYGVQQAAALAERLRDEPIHALYSSPQQRAIQTATPLARITGLPLQQREELREMDFGSWEDLPRSELARRDPDLLAAWDRGSWRAWPPDGETPQAVLARLVPCLDEIVKTHTGQTVLIVSHKTVLRLLIGHMLELNLRSSRRLEMEPTGLSEVHLQGDQATLVRYNDTTHIQHLRV